MTNTKPDVEPARSLTVSMTPEMRQWIDEEAKRVGERPSYIVRRAIRKLMEEQKAGK